MSETILLPQKDRSFKRYQLLADPIALTPALEPVEFNRTAYAAAHVVIDPLSNPDPFDSSPVVDWDQTLAFREHLYKLGFKVAEAMDTAQRGMGVDWPVAKELIQRSIRHAKTISGAELACGVGTDQLLPTSLTTLKDVEQAYREQLAVVQHEGGSAILMASRALAACAKSPQDYQDLYGRLIQDCDRPVVLHWLGEMFDPALKGYWGTEDVGAAIETVVSLINTNSSKVEGIKVSLLEPKWEIALRRKLPATVKMYTGDDFNYADLIAGDEQGYSHGLLGIFDPIANVASVALRELSRGNKSRYHELLDPTVELSREIFKSPTRHYKAGVVFMAWLNGHQDHFAMAGGAQASRDITHYARIFELADACRALSNPDVAVRRMQHLIALHCGS